MERTGGKRFREKWFLAGMLVIAAAAVLLFARGTSAKDADRIYKVICIGDSITYGTGVQENRDTDSYPALLQNLLGEACEVFNYGAGGRTLLNSGNKPYSATGYLEAAIREQPDVIIIMLGTNDSKPKNWDAKRYQTEYAALIDTLQENLKKTDIFIMIPPAAFTSGASLENNGIIDNEVIRKELHEIIPKVAEQTKVNLIDLYAVTQEHPEYYSDAVHPNRAGNEVLAQTIYEAIRQAVMR